MTEVLLISARRQGWATAVDLASELTVAGTVVRIGHAYEASGAPAGVETHRLRVKAGGVRALAVRAVSLLGPAVRTMLFAKYDPWLRTEGRRADAVVATDRQALLAVRQATRGNAEARVEEVGLDARASIAQRGGVAATLRKVLDRGMAAASPESLARAWSQVVADEKYREFAHHAPVFVQLLRRNQSFDLALQVAESAETLDLPEDVRERLQLEHSIATISSGEPMPAELGDQVRKVLDQADDAADAGQLEEAAQEVHQVVDAMFNRELHADVLASPLATDPDAFLAPLRNSRVFQTMGASAQGRPPGQQGQTRRLLIIPGEYANFTKPIIEEFSGTKAVEVRVLELKKKPRRRHQDTLILDRLRDATGHEVPPVSDEDRALLDWAETIFVDWCDNAAIWTTIHAPRKARIVIRFHSLEAISHQVHLIDWSRVSDAVFVGDHVRELVRRAVPAFADGPRIHVAPNAMQLERFGKPKLPGADRTIAMVGWAQRVKDPLWALEVLAKLRAGDPRWTLRLIGRDFQRRTHLSAMRYRDAFVERVQHDDVRDGIHYVEYTDDLPTALQDAGFILSSSRREGFPVGTTEGAAAGSVPVVRDWPMYAQYGGARGTFPPDWVVDTTDDAVKRILAHADSETRAAEGAAAREYVLEHFDWSVIRPTYYRILLGRSELA